MSNENKQSAYDLLPPKRRRFVDEYVKDCNGTQAAIRAGYSGKTAYSQAERLLKNVDVKQAVDERLAAIARENEVDASWVVDRAKKIVERCMQAEPVYDREGNPTGDYVFNANGANGALKILAKHLGMEVTRHELTGKDGEPLNQPGPDLSKLSTDELKAFLLLSKKAYGEKK